MRFLWEVSGLAELIGFGRLWGVGSGRAVVWFMVLWLCASKCMRLVSLNDFECDLE